METPVYFQINPSGDLSNAHNRTLRKRVALKPITSCAS